MRSYFITTTGRKIAVVAVCVLVIILFGIFSDSSHTNKSKDFQLQEERQLNEAVEKDREDKNQTSTMVKDMVKENEFMIDKLQRQLDNTRDFLLSKVKKDIKNEVITESKDNSDNTKLVIPILVTACNRPTVARCLDQLINLQSKASDDFPIIVSQDCDDKATANVLENYKEKITYVKHPAVDPKLLQGVKEHLKGYYKLSIHYKWAISKAFEAFPTSTTLIIVEDDIDVAVDFLSYFRAMHDLLRKDTTLWCASAWNDNGKPDVIDTKAATTVYRSDFFPGLGWMLKRSLWEDELLNKWPNAFWDDWMRNNDQRKDRACIRPEISRTSTFGKVGVSKGQFFEKHLKLIKLNDVDVEWSKEDLSYLFESNYNREFTEHVMNLPVKQEIDLMKTTEGVEIRLVYTKQNFKALAGKYGLMDDFKDGVPRTAYKGIVTSFHKGVRLYLTPPNGWNGYDRSWT